MEISFDAHVRLYLNMLQKSFSHRASKEALEVADVDDTLSRRLQLGPDR